MEQKQKPVFNKRIFWDVNFENLDYDKKAAFVISRVFERGDERSFGLFNYLRGDLQNERCQGIRT